MPDRIGRFTICRPLGSGGMSVVYEAYDDRLERSVALKLLRERGGSRRQARLQREAQALALLSHPNVVEVYETGMHQGRAFLVMERLPGMPLQRWLQASTRPIASILDCFVQAGRGLAAAHAQGLVHRDFKPSNVLVDADGRVRVFDFGLAAPSGDLSVGSSESLGPYPPLSGTAMLEGLDVGGSPEEVWETALTRTGAMLGTPAYMSPEQFEGRTATPKSDQFAFCIALYEALHGEHPFVEREDWEQLARAVLEGKVREPASGHRVPMALHRAIVRGLSVHASGRWPGMDALLVAIERARGQRRRRAWAGGTALATLATMGAAVALWLPGSSGEPLLCSGAPEKLAEVWSHERKSDVRGTMLDTGVPYASDTWRKVDARIDAHVLAWSDEHRRACEDTERGDQTDEVMDERMACLERRRRELGSLVDVLADADATVVRQAIAAVSELDAIESCRTPSPAHRAMAAPASPDEARQVGTHRAVLAQVRALSRAGKYSAGLELVRPTAAAADSLGYVPLQAEAQMQLGLLLSDVGSVDDAEPALERAYFLAEEVGHDEVTFDAACLLTLLVSQHQRRPDDGLAWAKHVRAAAERVGGNRAWARYLKVDGDALSGARRFEEALARYQDALPLYEQEWGAQHPHVAGVFNAMAMASTDMGEPAPGLEYMQRSLAIWEAALGPEHPEVCRMLNNQGLVLSSNGRDDEALEVFRRAHSLRHGLGPNHPDVAKPLANIAGILIRRKQYDEAAEHAEQALTIRARAYGEDSAEAARLHAVIGLIRLEQGQPERAQERLATAMVAIEQGMGPEHIELMAPLSKLSEAERQLGRLDDALIHAERALGVAKINAVGPIVTASLHQSLASARWDHGDRAGAWDQIELARQAYEALDPPRREQVGELIEQLQTWERDHPSPQ